MLANHLFIQALANTSIANDLFTLSSNRGRTRGNIVKILVVLLVLSVALINTGSVSSNGTNLVFVSNEKSNTITVLDANHGVVKTLKTCRRPRGMHFSADRTQFYVGCADDSQISIFDVASQMLVGRIRGVE